MAKARSLTVYLIKRSEPDPRLLVKLDPDVKQHTISSPSGRVWSLFVKRADPKPPRWADFFVPQVNPGEFGLVGSASAILLIPGEGLWWAVTFGQGRNLLHDG